MKRIMKYRRFRQNIKKMIAKLAAADACPLGPEAITGYHLTMRMYNQLNAKWQAYVDAAINRINAPYFTPDENDMSGWDYDQLMLK